MLAKAILWLKGSIVLKETLKQFFNCYMKVCKGILKPATETNSAFNKLFLMLLKN